MELQPGHASRARAAGMGRSGRSSISAQVWVLGRQSEHAAKVWVFLNPALVSVSYAGLHNAKRSRAYKRMPQLPEVPTRAPQGRYRAS